MNTEAAALNEAVVEAVEEVTYRATAGGDIDMGNFDGETALTLDRTKGASDVTNLRLDTDLTLNKLTATADSTLTYLASDVDGDSDSGKVTVDGVEDGAEVDFAGAVENFSVTASGSASRLDNFVLPATVTALSIDAQAGFRVDDTFTSAGVESLTITGNSDVRIDPALDASTETVDASATTGDVALTMGAADQTITTNSGDDTIDMGENLDRNDTINLGDGNDTLQVDLDSQAVNSFDLDITNVETFAFDNTAANNGAISLKGVALDNVTIDGVNGASQANTAGLITLSNFTTDVTTFDFIGQGDDGSSSDNVAFNGISVGYDLSGTEKVPSVTVNVNNGGVEADDIFVDDLDLDKVEALILNASDIGSSDSDSLTVANIDGDELTSLSIVADGNVVITDLDDDGANKIETIDLSGVTGGGVTLDDISGNAAALTIIGSDGDDQIDSGVATANNEVEVDLGAGNDSYLSTVATDIITTGSGTDTITFLGTAADDVNVITDFTAGNGGDIIDFVTNIAADDTTTLTSTETFTVSKDDALVAGLTIIDNSQAAIADADSLSEADIVDRLNDLGDDDNDGAADDIVSMDNSSDVAYVAISDGTDTAIVLVDGDTSNGDTDIGTDEVTVLVTLQGVDSAGDLSANNFADFL